MIMPSPLSAQAVAASPADMSAVEFRYGQVDHHPLFNENALIKKSHTVVERVYNRQNALHIEVQVGFVDEGRTKPQTITLDNRKAACVSNIIQLVQQGIESTKGSRFSSPDPFCLCAQEKAGAKLELLQGKIVIQALIKISTGQALNHYPKLVFCSAPDLSQSMMEKHDWDLAQAMIG
jgi:hypothetical protein